MSTVIEQPSKEAVRVWMKDRREADKPPPEPATIRQELGWNMSSAFDPKNRDCPR